MAKKNKDARVQVILECTEHPRAFGAQEVQPVLEENDCS